jgi:CheY-like chemotaxis protein
VSTRQGRGHARPRPPGWPQKTIGLRSNTQRHAVGLQLRYEGPPPLQRSSWGKEYPDINGSKAARRVAIFNSRPDFIEALRVALEADGFTTACAHLADIQNGTLDLLAFVHLHKPELIIYDLPRPYESHWNFLRLLKETDSLRTATWVLTTTDKKALEAAVGASGVVEIIFGEPYGVTDVVAAVGKTFPVTPEGLGLDG